MFQIGDFVVYGNKGIHKIMKTTSLSLDGVSEEKLYYLMQPLAKPEGSVYAPVSSEKTNMRSVMDKSMAEHFLSLIPSIPLIDIKSRKLCEDRFKEIIRESDPVGLMQIIKTLRKRKEERKQVGKKLTVSDMHYLEQAEHNLYDELSISLSEKSIDIQNHILNLISESQEVQDSLSI